MLQSSTEGIIGSSEASFSNVWARAEALGRGCSARVRDSEDEEDQLAFHMNTTPIIADMTAILELHGKWRDEQARKWMASHESDLTEARKSETIERTRWKRTKRNCSSGVFHTARLLEQRLPQCTLIVSSVR